MVQETNSLILYGVPFSQPVRAVMWLMLYKRLPFELSLINPGSKGESGSRNPAYLAKNPGGTIPMIVNQHLILTPYRRAKLTPPPCFDGGCPGSPREGPARLRVALCVTRSEAAWEGPVGPPGQPGRRRNVGIRWGS